MPLVSTNIDNNQSLIKRAGTVVMDNVTSDPHRGIIARNEAQPPGSTGTLQNQTADYISRDFTIANRINQQSINANLRVEHQKVPAASGIDIHGQRINGVQGTAYTLSADHAADDDGITDTGEFVTRRHKSSSATDYPDK